MKYWKYTTDSDHFQTLYLTDYGRDSPLLFHDENYKRGRLLSKPFPNVSVAYVKDLKELSPSQRALAQQGKLRKGDFPSLYGLEVVFSERALQVLESLIQGGVQIMPLHCDEDQLYLIHITDLIDCLDRPKSEIKWVTGYEGNLVFRIDHYVFDENNLIGKNIFKFPELFTSTFVSDDFKTAVEDHELQGLRWDPLP